MGIKPKKSKAGAGGGKKSQKGFEKSNSASSGGGKERGKHRGSVSLAASKGKSATKGKKSN